MPYVEPTAIRPAHDVRSVQCVRLQVGVRQRRRLIAMEGPNDLGITYAEFEAKRLLSVEAKISQEWLYLGEGPMTSWQTETRHNTSPPPGPPH